MAAAYDAKGWVELARQVEDLGYSTFTMPDHFTQQLAPMPALMTAAAATESLRIGALVFDNDYKHPVVLAKELATIDVLSDGRWSSASAPAGWPATTKLQGSLRPTGRAHRPFRGGGRGDQGHPLGRAVLVRRPALLDHRLRRSAAAHPTTAPTATHRRRWPESAVDRRPRSQHRRHQRDDDRRHDRSRSAVDDEYETVADRIASSAGGRVRINDIE